MEPISFGEAFSNFFTMFINASLVVEILVMTFVAVCLTGFFKLRRNVILMHVAYFFGVAALMLLTTAFGYALASSANLKPAFIAPTIIGFMLLSGALFLGIFSKGNRWHRALRISFYLSICYLTTEIAHNYNLIIDGYVEMGSPLQQFLFCLPHLLLIPIGLQAGRLKIHHISRFRRSLTIQYILVFASILATAFLSSFATNDDRVIRLWLIMILVLLGFIDLFAYGSNYYTSKRERTIVELEARSHLNEAASTMLKLNEQDIANNTRARHDLKNTLAFIRGAIEQGRYQDAIAFIDETAGKAYGDLQLVDCGNAVISSIMNLELRKAKLSNVDVRYRLIVPPTLGIPDVDLCSLLTNILDNAIEGTLASGKAGYVDFSVVATGTMLRIQCKNPTKLRLITHLSTKTEAGHGHGTAIIKSIVKEYGGYYEFAVKDSVYSLDCVMNLNARPEDYDA